MTVTLAGLLEEAGRSFSLPRRELQQLLASACASSEQQLIAYPETPVTELQVQQFRTLCRRRLDGEPMAYLLGQAGFWNLELVVDDRALIPRPDTELLVEFALELGLPDNARVADLGAGSGAIALALASERPGWSVTAVERDPDAAALCAENIREIGVANVELLNFDWCNLKPGASLELVVSNPPYVEEDFEDLGGTLRFEPRHALVAGPDGLDALREVIPLAAGLLRDGGWCAVEHGFEQGAAVRDIFHACGYSLIATHRDLAGHERISVGLWQVPA